MAAFQLLGLDLHIGLRVVRQYVTASCRYYLVDTKCLSQLNVGDEKREFCIEIEEQNSEVFAHDDPVLTKVPGDSALHCLLVESAEVNVSVWRGRVVLGGRGHVAGVPWGRRGSGLG